MQVEIRTPEGDIAYTVPVLRIRDYGVRAIIRRQLYFLIPFYSFTVSNRFRELNESHEALESHLEELDQLLEFLLEAVEQGTLSSYEGTEISDAIYRTLSGTGTIRRSEKGGYEVYGWKGN